MHVIITQTSAIISLRWKRAQLTTHYADCSAFTISYFFGNYTLRQNKG